jgi:hypothetical protein
MDVIRASQRWRHQVVYLAGLGLSPRDPIFLEHFPLKRDENGFVLGIGLRTDGLFIDHQRGARSEIRIRNRRHHRAMARLRAPRVVGTNQNKPKVRRPDTAAASAQAIPCWNVNQLGPGLAPVSESWASWALSNVRGPSAGGKFESLSR